MENEVKLDRATFKFLDNCHDVLRDLWNCNQAMLKTDPEMWERVRKALGAKKDGKPV